MHNSLRRSAVISGILGVLAFVVFILSWGMTPPSNLSIRPIVFIFIGACLAVTAVILGRRTEMSIKRNSPPADIIGELRFWLRMGKAGGFIVLLGSALALIGLIVSLITG